MGGSRDVSPTELLRVLRDEAGLDLATLAPVGAGESRAAFWVTDHNGTVSLLKIMPGAGPAALSHLRTLGATVDRLRHRGYPAAPLTAFGRTAGFAFWIQRRLPGRPFCTRWGRPDAARLARMLPDLFRLNDVQAGLSTGDAAGWPGSSPPTSRAATAASDTRGERGLSAPPAPPSRREWTSRLAGW